jgi:hypothetical protein
MFPEKYQWLAVQSSCSVSRAYVTSVWSLVTKIWRPTFEPDSENQYPIPDSRYISGITKLILWGLRCLVLQGLDPSVTGTSAARPSAEQINCTLLLVCTCLLQQFPISTYCISVCCQVEVSASDWSPVQRSPIQCRVSECDREAPIMRPYTTRGLFHHEKTKEFSKQKQN